MAGIERNKRRKRATTNVVARFLDAPLGPPTSWVPPRVSLPLNHLFIDAHIPLEREGADAASHLLLMVVVARGRDGDVASNGVRPVLGT